MALENRFLGRRPFSLPGNGSFISFTFDDFPKTAYINGGKILKDHGLVGTYYVSLGLMGEKTDTGEIADVETLEKVLYEGHELGCHTYSHLDPRDTDPIRFETSIRQNLNALSAILPDFEFKTFAYPYGNVTPKAKRIAKKYFSCCRGGKQDINKNRIDLNLLNAYFIDLRKNESLQEIRNVISRNQAANGWLIFATHGVEQNPSEFGCTPGYFEKVVRHAVESGAVILPVVGTLDAIGCKLR